MQYIGKADKFYTLWEVTEEKRTSFRGTTYKIIHHQYFKNISFDLNKAKAKYPNAIVDETLRGHHSWNSYEYEKLPSDEFQRGKYQGEKIVECKDINYLYWAWNNLEIIPYESQELVIGILEKEGYRKINESHIATPSEVEEIDKSFENAEAIKNSIDTNGKFNITPSKNLDEFGYLNMNSMMIAFPNVKEMEYAGYLYSLPIDSKGKAKRIKNKEIEIIPESYEVIIDENGCGATLNINVKDFKIIK